MELMSCPNLAVPRDVMHHVVRVESSYNPYAIGVVGGRLARQPRNLAEAVSTARMLEQRGYNFSLGLAQVNRYNLTKYGLTSYEQAFQPCANLVAGSRILRECYGRSGNDWGKSFSCYYSGDFKTGFRHGYVQKVYASMRRGGNAATAAVIAEPIVAIDRARKRVTALGRFASSQAPHVGTSLARRRSAPISHPNIQSSTPALHALVVGSKQAPATAQAGSDAVPPPTFVPTTVRPAATIAAATQPRVGGPAFVHAARVGETSSNFQPVPAAQTDSDGAFVF
jgi:type IV secretion system protein VirB1